MKVIHKRLNFLVITETNFKNEISWRELEWFAWLCGLKSRKNYIFFMVNKWPPKKTQIVIRTQSMLPFVKLNGGKKSISKDIFCVLFHLQEDCPKWLRKAILMPKFQCIKTIKNRHNFIMTIAISTLQPSNRIKLANLTQ